MKVFELMKQLSVMPAGADIEFSTLMTVEEFLKGDRSDEEDKAFYEVRVSVCEAEEASETKVFIYGECEG